MKTYNIVFLICIIGMASIASCVKNEGNSEAKAEVINIETKDEVVPNDIYPDSTIVISSHDEFTRKHYPKRIEIFKTKPLKGGEIVFLGDSNTEYADDWSKKVNQNKARNRGISGDTTEGVLERLGEVIYHEPEQVFILIGTNDLFRDYMTSEKIFENIKKIVKQIHEGSPETEIFVHSILPTNEEYLQDKIQLTNALLANFESKGLYKFIDLNTHFSTEEDLMNMKLSTDGVHLNDEGYSLWVNTITNLIKR